jgi:hypothetical protein
MSRARVRPRRTRHATNDAPDFAKLNWRAQVRPIYWNTVGNCYLDLAEPELRFLTRPFDVHGFAMSRPEVLGRDPISEAWRLLRRPRVDLTKSCDSVR